MARRPRILLAITRADLGGAVIHVLGLVDGLGDRVEYHLAVGPDNVLAERAASRGATVHVIPHLVREIAPIADARAVGELLAVTRAVRPDAIHAHTFKAGFAARLVGRLARVPVVYTPHGWVFSEGYPRTWRVLGGLVEGLLARATATVICVSHAELEAARRRKVCGDGRGTVIHNGVADAPPRRRGGGRSGPLGIAMIARLAQPKDHDTLLRAMALVDVDYRLLLVGDGPRRAGLESLSASLGIAGRVRFLGARSDVAEILRDADVLVLASRSEGLPLTVLEGMREGLPVVASDVGGVSEAVQHERTGLLVPAGDPAALAAAITAMASSAERRARMGAAGRRSYEEAFRLDAQMGATLDVYRRVIAGHRHGSGA